MLLLLEILGNMCIVIICLPVCDVVDFKNNLSFIIKPFSYLTKKAEQKFKHLKNGKGFSHEIKSLFHYFERAFFSWQKFRPKSGPFREISLMAKII